MSENPGILETCLNPQIQNVSRRYDNLQLRCISTALDLQREGSGFDAQLRHILLAVIAPCSALGLIYTSSYNIYGMKKRYIKQKMKVCLFNAKRGVDSPYRRQVNFLLAFGHISKRQET